MRDGKKYMGSGETTGRIGTQGFAKQALAS
jgi:hypothetical protein